MSPGRDGLCRAPFWGWRHWHLCCLPHSDGAFPDLQRLQPPGLLPLAFSAEPTVISAEMKPYLSLSACHPCLQIQPGTSAQPDQISAAWVAGQGHRRLSALSDCGSHVGCAGRLSLSTTASQRKAQAGAVGTEEHPRRGSRWGSRCEGWAQSCPVHNVGSPAPSLLGHLLGLDSQPFQPQALPCPVAQSLGPSLRVPWGDLGC